MGIIDLAIVAVLILTVASGYFRGFMTTFLTCMSALLSSLIAGIFYPVMASSIKAAGKLIPSILNYTESADMIGSIDVFRMNVSQIDSTQLIGMAQKLNLPAPLNKLFIDNLLSRRYATEGIDWFGEYLSRTIAEMAVNIMSYIIIFAICFVILLVAVRLVDFVVDLPVLKHADSLCGVVMGFLLGVSLLFVMYTALPVVLAFVPFDRLRIMVDSSVFSQLYYGANPFLGGIKSFIR